MSRYWLATSIICFCIAVAIAVAGYAVRHLLPFTQALFGALISVFLAFSIAIFFIEGPSMTRLGRRNKIIKKVSKGVISDATYQISWSTLGLGRWLGSALPEQVDVDSEIHAQESQVGSPDWESSTNPVLRKVFHQAGQVCSTDIDTVDPIPVDKYQETLVGTRNIAGDIRRRMESNIDVQERLFELSDALGKLEEVLTRCWWPENIREEENRFRGLGALGTACVDFHEALSRIHRRL